MNASVAMPVVANASPFEGKAVLTASQAASLMAEQLYLNIHTAANPTGEIRDQVTKAK